MTGKIFISYRRDDAAGEAGRIHDRLRQDFGPSSLFMDVDAIPLGEDFLEVLQRSIRGSAALVAVIGPNWLDIKDSSGRRRLDDPRDIVRNEIALAGELGVPVYPLLVDEASMPATEALPENIRYLATRNALVVRHASFHKDVDKLVAALEISINHHSTRVSEFTTEFGSTTGDKSSDTDYRYSAAISFAHADAKFARWLREALERYAVPSELVGRPSLIGPVLKKIGPVYTDRQEMLGSLGIGKQIESALTASRSLLVLCSRSSASSPHVNEEVSVFLREGRTECIVPILLAGELGPNDESPLPPALRTRVSSGTVRLVDVRGLENSARLAAVVARLLNVPTVKLLDIENSRKRKRIIRRASMTTAFVLLAGALLYWYILQSA